MVPGEVPISRVTIDWQQIERAYGESLSADVRKTVFAATEFFLLFEELERTGEPVAHIQTIIEACKRRASEFQQALPSHELGSGVSAMLFIRKNFNDPRLSDRLFGILHGLLTSLGVACNAALKELSEFSSLKEGDEWKSWIRKLTKIMKKPRGPYGANLQGGRSGGRERPRRLGTGKLASWHGNTFCLGDLDQIENPATYFMGGALRVHADPLAWLKADREGIVILRTDLTYAHLRSCQRLVCDDPPHAMRLEQWLQAPKSTVKILIAEKAKGDL